jgi:hypothetical protein
MPRVSAEASSRCLWTRSAQRALPCHPLVPADLAEASSLVAFGRALVPRVSAEASSRCLWTRSAQRALPSPPSGPRRLGRSLLFGRPPVCPRAPRLGRSLLALPLDALGLSVPCPRHLPVPAVLAEASSLVAFRCALVPRDLAEASSRCLWTRSDLASSSLRASGPRRFGRSLLFGRLWTRSDLECRIVDVRGV